MEHPKIVPQQPRLRFDVLDRKAYRTKIHAALPGLPREDFTIGNQISNDYPMYLEVFGAGIAQEMFVLEIAEHPAVLKPAHCLGRQRRLGKARQQPQGRESVPTEMIEIVNPEPDENALADLPRQLEKALKELPRIIRDLGATTERFEHPLLETRTEGVEAIVVITADRGLAGAYNANVLKVAEGLLRGVRERGSRRRLAAAAVEDATEAAFGEIEHPRGRVARQARCCDRVDRVALPDREPCPRRERVDDGRHEVAEPGILRPRRLVPCAVRAHHARDAGHDRLPCALERDEPADAGA